ncbi:hypothetical protein [Brevibacillus borstelensis]|uniref:hypothetical protein n=1 Tax=Brevibacillus borstelensis TaxID=45462 RepID=UPI00203AA823|nr:hypothetical protein [Brevibacillus borstelensis]MCM3471651.1 hypothetical protein [Brevibacillus borstelensis]
MKKNKWMMLGLLAVASSAMLTTGAFAKESEKKGTYVVPPSSFLGKSTVSDSSQSEGQAAAQATTSLATPATMPVVSFFAPYENENSDK